MLTPERIPELQGTGELPGSNQKSRPIDLPFVFYFPHFIPPLGEGISLGIGCKQNAVFLGWIFCEGERNLRAICGAVNPNFLCISKIGLREFLRASREWRISEDSLLVRRCGPYHGRELEKLDASQQKISTSKNRVGADVLICPVERQLDKLLHAEKWQSFAPPDR
jgi:hypothetical protein